VALDVYLGIMIAFLFQQKEYQSNFYINYLIFRLSYLFCFIIGIAWHVHARDLAPYIVEFCTL
jgi:hypothetical protein